MQPLVVWKDEILVAGMRYEGENKLGEIPALWGKEFIPRASELDALRSEAGTFYGVGRALPGVVPGPFEYLAAAPVTSTDRLPHGMVGWRLPAHFYAVLPAYDVAGIGAVLGYFHGAWLPGSNDWVEADDYMFEHYTESFPRDHIIYLYFPVKPKAGAGPTTVYRPQPQVVEKGAVRLVGVEDLFTDGRGVKTGTEVPGLYTAAAVRMGEIKGIRSPMVMVGDNRADSPADVWQPGRERRQLAGFEVTEFREVPKDMGIRLLPPSRYAIFTCEAPLDAQSKQPLAPADWGPVFPYYAQNRDHWRFADRDYYLEFFHHADLPDKGYPIVRYELWIPVG